MYRRLGCDWPKVVRGAQPLVGCHGFNRVGSFGGRGSLLVSLVKAVLRALISQILFQELQIGSQAITLPQNETGVRDRSSFRTLCLW